MDGLHDIDDGLPQGDEPGALPQLHPIAVRPDPITPALWGWAADSLEQTALYYRSMAVSSRRMGRLGEAHTYEREADRAWREAQRHRELAR